MWQPSFVTRRSICFLCDELQYFVLVSVFDDVADGEMSLFRLGLFRPVLLRDIVSKPNKDFLAETISILDII
jgi:hypothetical protein